MSRKQFVVAAITALCCAGFASSWIAYEKARLARESRQNCRKQLKALWESFTAYADEGANNSHSPPKLEHLPAFEKLFWCPGDGPALAPVGPKSPAFPHGCDFQYAGSLEIRSSVADPQPLVWDAPHNHAGCGHVLYTDESVQSFAGDDWGSFHATTESQPALSSAP